MYIVLDTSGCYTYSFIYAMITHLRIPSSTNNKGYHSLADPTRMAQAGMGVHNRQTGPHDSILGRLDDFVAGMLACDLLLWWSCKKWGSPQTDGGNADDGSAAACSTGSMRVPLACTGGLFVITAGCLCLNMSQLALLPYVLY